MALAFLAAGGAGGMGCGDLVGSGDEVVALVTELPASGRVDVEEEDTTRIPAWALTRSGDSVMPGITWREFEPRGVIALDTLTGDIVGLLGGDSTRVQARYQSLRGNPIRVRVLAAADTVQPGGPSADTVEATESVSSRLQVELLDLTTEPGVPRGLPSRPAVFTISNYALSGVRLLEAPDSAALVVTTDQGGRAGVTLERVPGGTAADSVLVEATAHRATGAAVPGSPVRFVVYFR